MIFFFQGLWGCRNGRQLHKGNTRLPTETARCNINQNVTLRGWGESAAHRCHRPWHLQLLLIIIYIEQFMKF